MIYKVQKTVERHDCSRSEEIWHKEEKSCFLMHQSHIAVLRCTHWSQWWDFCRWLSLRFCQVWKWVLCHYSIHRLLYSLNFVKQNNYDIAKVVKYLLLFPDTMLDTEKGLNDIENAFSITLLYGPIYRLRYWICLHKYLSDIHLRLLCQPKTEITVSTHLVAEVLRSAFCQSRNAFL